ncbi:hypothetical protein GUJ93_ZPchr0002g24362 [Zizania palustris]|uniref:Uncharacterized protein n=1 Tax=Zizania palustris TaxID=103762 RepID=A0A8J5SFE9_ZIZPA|nr:hypothetical protein GUJ93_ZPchr0002g24362 [Zizania palustris]
MRPHLIMNKRWSLNSPIKKIMNLNPSLPIVVATTTSRSVPGQCRWRPEGRRDLIRQQHRQADAVAASVSSPPTTKMADDQALGQAAAAEAGARVGAAVSWIQPVRPILLLPS